MACMDLKSETKKINIQMTCLLGNHPLVQPKLLSCQHSFCKTCIKATVNQGGNDFKCPKCQLSTPMTEKDVDQLQEDVLYQIFRDYNERGNCVLCKFENKKAPGTFQCLDCADVLCTECKGKHTYSSYTRLHRVVPVKDIEEVQDTNRLMCQTHSKINKPSILDYYCEDCKCFACPVCVLAEHQPNGHTFKSIIDLHDENRSILTGHVTTFLDIKQLDEELVVELEQYLVKNKEVLEELENEVHQRAALFIDIVENVKQDKLAEIKGHFEEEDSATQIKLAEIKNRIIHTGSIVSYTQAFLEHSDKTEFFQNEVDMKKRLTDQVQNKFDRTFKKNLLEIGQPQFDDTKSYVAEALGKIKVVTMTMNEEELASCSNCFEELNEFDTYCSNCGHDN